jgi:hypothetical protein
MKFPAAVIAVFLALSVSADELPSGFKTALRRALDADAVWTMTKTIGASPVKLKLEGRVSCAKGRGIVWSGEKPFKMRISMTAGEMRFSDPEGERVVPSSEMSHYKDVRSAIDGFIAGHDAPFDELFEITPEESASGWNVKFTPKRSDMRHVIKSVSVSGAETLDRAQFNYASGECAVFEFRETGRGTHALWKGGE